MHTFLSQNSLAQRSFLECWICDVIFQTLNTDIKDHLLALIPLTFWVEAITRKVTSAPEFPSSPFSTPSPSILKIKQVCKRDLRSMNSHQPHHLATVCFLSKWGWLLRAANDIEIYAVAHALPLEFWKIKKLICSQWPTVVGAALWQQDNGCDLTLCVQSSDSTI